MSCSISRQMFGISGEDLDSVIGEICSSSDTNDIDLCGGTVTSLFVLNLWTVSTSGSFNTRHTRDWHSLNNLSDTQSTLDWHSDTNWPSMDQLVYYTTLDDLSMKISCSSADGWPRCSSCDGWVSVEIYVNQVLIEMSIKYRLRVLTLFTNHIAQIT